MELMDYLESAKLSLFRWEGLQNYEVGDETDMEEWWSFIERKISNGITAQRVRLVTLPPTPYTREEVATHKISVSKGDDIRYVLDRGENEMNGFSDFWLIDDSLVVQMNYGSGGEYIDFSVTKDDLQKYLDFKNKVLPLSEPIQNLEL